MQPTDRWEYVFDQWFGSQANGTASGGRAYWYGIDQYLYYRINNCWQSGLRFQWFRDEDGTRVALNRPSNPNKPPFVGNFISLSAGVNWTPRTNCHVASRNSRGLVRRESSHRTVRRQCEELPVAAQVRRDLLVLAVSSVLEGTSKI